MMSTESIQTRIKEKDYELSSLYRMLGQAVAHKANEEREGRTSVRISRKVDALTNAILARHAEIETNR